MNKKLKLWELNRVSTQVFKTQKKFPIIVILDNIRSLNNIGSFFRTADAFNVKKIYLCGITAQPPHRDIHKTALGATDSVDWEHVESTVDLVKSLQKEGVKVFAIEQAKQTTMLQNMPNTDKQEIAVVFGNEVNGVQQEVVDLCDEVVEIPQFGTKHSFNVAVSAGIVLWELVRRRI